MDDLPEVFWLKVTAKADSIPRRIRAKRWLKAGLRYNLRCELVSPTGPRRRRRKPTDEDAAPASGY